MPVSPSLVPCCLLSRVAWSLGSGMSIVATPVPEELCEDPEPYTQREGETTPVNSSWRVMGQATSEDGGGTGRGQARPGTEWAKQGCRSQQLLRVPESDYITFQQTQVSPPADEVGCISDETGSERLRNMSEDTQPKRQQDSKAPVLALPLLGHRGTRAIAHLCP